MISNSDVVKRQPEGAVFPSDWDNFDQLVSDVYVAWPVQCEMENWEKLGASGSNTWIAPGSSCH